MIKKLLIRGVDKTIKGYNGLTAYSIAENKNYSDIMESLKTVSFFKKHFCMETEIDYFEPKKKNHLLFIIINVLVILKTAYFVFNLVFVFGNTTPLREVVDCLGIN